MKTPSEKLFISLGSNLGDRLQNMQKAVEAIYRRIGSVLELSSVYSSPSKGFDGPDFLNACIVVESVMSPIKILNELTEIEKELKRVRDRTQQNPLSRTIDLDILYIDDLVYEDDLLTIPHPRLSERKFVLLPLLDLAQTPRHPVLKKELEELLAECNDPTKVVQDKERLINPRQSMVKLLSGKSFVIEGNIGVGKTSFARLFAREFGGSLLLENFADNSFLPRFYNNPTDFAFKLELSLLIDRYHQLQNKNHEDSSSHKISVSDYGLFKSLIFSKLTLADDEFTLIEKLFYTLFEKTTAPDLYVFLDQKVEQLQKNIEKRGRHYEQKIKNEYLEKIEKGYKTYMQGQKETLSLIVNLSDLDFVLNRSDFMSIVDQMKEAISKTKAIA